MNRRDQAMIAHLDAIEGRILQALRDGFAEVGRRLTKIEEDIVGMKIEHATHNHGDES